MDFTKLQSATVVLNQEEYELADFLLNNDVLVLRENDHIDITCNSGNQYNIVLYLRVLDTNQNQDMSSTTSKMWVLVLGLVNQVGI